MATEKKEELEELSKQDELVKEVYGDMIKINKDDTITRTISEEEEAAWVQEYREEVAYDKGISDTAKRMLSKNYEISEISEITGLPIEEINSLKNALNN